MGLVRSIVLYLGMLVSAATRITSAATSMNVHQLVPGHELSQNHNGNAIPPSHEYVKRELQTRRSAQVTYHCPASGYKARSFSWKASYNLLTNRITMTGLENIASWEHIEVVANFFRSRFRAVHTVVVETTCCTHKIRGQIIGAVFNDRRHIMTQLTTAHNYEPQAMQIVELCVHVSQHERCPAGTGSRP